MQEKRSAVVSALWYTGTSAAMALAFYLLTGGGQYDVVARYGGAAWVFILAMIITMPLIIPWIKKRHG